MKHGELNQHNLKIKLLDGLSSYTNCCKGFLAEYLVGSNIIFQYKNIITNNAEDIMPYRFEIKLHTNRIRTYFVCQDLNPDLSDQ
jgi:hypothetical protein